MRKPSLREYFAARAMQSLLIDRAESLTSLKEAQGIAKDAYAMADVMLREGGQERLIGLNEARTHCKQAIEQAKTNVVNASIERCTQMARSYERLLWRCEDWQKPFIQQVINDFWSLAKELSEQKESTSKIVQS